MAVIPIPGVGTPFDPRLHEAVGTIPATALPPDTVAAEVRRGFLLDGEVLRARLPSGPASDTVESLLYIVLLPPGQRAHFRRSDTSNRSILQD